MHLLQPDRALHHTVSRDDALVTMRTAFPSIDITFYYITVYKGFVRVLKIRDQINLGWAPAQ